jgi:hypothetical protein
LPGGTLQDGDWIRLNPSPQSNIVDPYGNRVHSQNRWVQIRELELPAKVDSARYTSDVITGFPDYAYISFDKNVDIARWFTNGSFKFEPDGAVVPVTTDGYLAPVPGRPNQVRVSLREAYPESQRRVRTGGSMSVTINFNPTIAALGWAPLPNQPINDNAKPVIASDTVHLKFGGLKEDGSNEPDTLIVVYSEALLSYALSQPLTVVRWVNNSTSQLLIGNPVLINPVDEPTQTEYVKVKYLVDSTATNVDDYASGDSVFISFIAGVTDIAGNVQDEMNNRKALLMVDRGKINWSTNIKNNPFRGGSGKEITIELKPGARGATVRVRSATIRLYDSMGNLVLEEKIQPSDNFKIPSALTNNEPFYSWQWNGRNRKGRVVGTGTYLFKAVFDAAAENSEGGIEGSYQQYRIAKPVGFVRGK